MLILVCFILVLGCANKAVKENKGGIQSDIVRNMIEAVNEKNAEKYVKGFADRVQVFVESEMKVDGIEALKKNRAKHFQNHPQVRSEIQHLVEIDNKVILHDKVWLTTEDKQGRDIVEIFTFENNEVVKIDVIQPRDLFQD